MSSFQAVNVSVDTLLQEYEQLTGNVLIKDGSLSANALPLSISVLKPVPSSELARIIQSVSVMAEINRNNPQWKSFPQPVSEGHACLYQDGDSK
jgi:hypothetical protein